MAEAAVERAVPVLVAYDIPGRDCAQYSAGGALSQADYEAWINGVRAGHRQRQGDRHPGTRRARQHALGLRAARSSVYPFTDAERIAELQYAVTALEADPGVSVYLDGTHSAWQSVGTITQRLLAADVQQAQGFFLNVSNYQPDPEPPRLRHLDLRLHRDGDRPVEPALQQPGGLRQPVLPGHPCRTSAPGA